MIEFSDYNITIVFSVYPKGIDLKDSNRPYLVREVLFTKEWEGFARQKEIEDWCNVHRNQTLAIHELQPNRIRYAILHRDPVTPDVEDDIARLLCRS